MPSPTFPNFSATNARRTSTPDGPVAFGRFAFAAAGMVADRATAAGFNPGGNPRTHAPVWRNSYTVGQIEDRVWKPINGGTARGGKRWTKALMKMAEKLELKTRAKRRETDPGARNGDIGDVGLKVLRFLYETVDYATGRLEPSIRTIADEIGHAYSAVHRALVRLRKLEFVGWMRRSKPKENPEPSGPQVEQASNAYALLCPKGLTGWLQKLFAKAPAPECDADRRKRERSEFEAMLESLTTQERHAATWTGSALLGETLGAIAAKVDERERNKRESSRSDETGDIC